MRSTKFLLALFFASTVFLSMSCSKEIDNTHTPEYKIEGFDRYCIEVIYKDADGKFVSTNDRAEFPGGIKKLTVAKPFFGFLELRVDNFSITTKTYELSIVIDGESKMAKTMTVPMFNATREYLEFELK